MKDWRQETIDELYETYGVDKVDGVFKSAYDFLEESGDSMYRDYIRDFKMEDNEDSFGWFRLDFSLLFVMEHFKQSKLN